MRLLRRHRPGQAQPAHRPAAARPAPQPRAPEPRAPAWRAGDALDRAEDDVITLGGIFGREYDGICRTAIERLIAAWQAKTGSQSARARSFAIGGALCSVVVVILAMLGTFRPGGPAGTGTAGCAALPDPRQVTAAGYQMIRVPVSAARWPDLRLAGTSSIDLLAALRTARSTDRHEAVWFYRRPARARHGAKVLCRGPLRGPPGSLRHRAPAPRPACLTWRTAGGARLNSEVCAYALFAVIGTASVAKRVFRSKND